MKNNVVFIAKTCYVKNIVFHAILKLKPDIMTFMIMLLLALEILKFLPNIDSIVGKGLPIWISVVLAIED